MLRSHQDHGFHPKLLNEIYIQSCRPAGEEGNPVLQNTATRNLAGCQRDSHPHKTNKQTNKEILGITDQKVCHPSSLKAVGVTKIKVTVDRDKHGLLEKMLHGFCKEKPCLTNPFESLDCISRDREEVQQTQYSPILKKLLTRFHIKGYQRN